MGKGKLNMVDVVPELLENIETEFKSISMADRTLASVSKRIRDGTATEIDGHKYAERLGKNASKALQMNLTESTLPDGKLYYNIATRTVVPVLENNQRLINEAAISIQKAKDVKTGIGLNPISPKFPVERINGLIDKMTADDITLEDALVWIREPIVNNSEAFYDDFIRENVKFRSDAGLRSTITRIAESKACEWCQALEGTFEYGDAPEDIYRRHEFCRCSLTTTYKKTTQDVWSKRSWESTPEEIERREGTKPEQMTVQERQVILDRLERDKLIQQLMDVTGLSREDAREITYTSEKNIQKWLKRGRIRR